MNFCAIVTADHDRKITKCSEPSATRPGSRGRRLRSQRQGSDRRQAHRPVIADNENAAFPKESGGLRGRIEGRR